MTGISRVIALMSLCLFSYEGTAGIITYNSERLPTFFSEILLNTIPYNVSVTWEQSFDQVYGVAPNYNAPLFMDKRVEAWAAADALLLALINDNYTVKQTPYSISIPYQLTPGGFSGAGVPLSHLTGLTSTGLYSRGLALTNQGYTQWALVPIPSTALLFLTGILLGAGTISYRRLRER